MSLRATVLAATIAIELLAALLFAYTFARRPQDRSTASARCCAAPRRRTRPAPAPGDVRHERRRRRRGVPLDVAGPRRRAAAESSLRRHLCAGPKVRWPAVATPYVIALALAALAFDRSARRLTSRPTLMHTAPACCRRRRSPRAPRSTASAALSLLLLARAYLDGSARRSRSSSAPPSMRPLRSTTWP